MTAPDSTDKFLPQAYETDKNFDKNSFFHYQTPKQPRLLTLEDQFGTQSKRKGFKVYIDAFESYYDDGISGEDLRRKAVSHYSNWAAQEWQKPVHFSDKLIPFIRKKSSQKSLSPSKNSI